MADQLADRIRAVRARLSMTQDDMAMALDVSQGAVSRWETGRHAPTDKQLLRLAQLAKVSVAELRYGVDAILPEDASEIPPMRRMTDLLDYCADRARSIGKNDIGVAIDIILEKCKADDSRHPTDRRFDDYSGEERRSQSRS